MAAVAGAAGLGCSEGQQTPQTVERKPTLSLVQSGASAVDVQIAGPEGLRGLQARLAWDPAAVKVKKLEPGKDAARLDRVFFADPAKADGSLIFGLTDTRQVRLPARGALLRVQLERVAGSDGAATLRVEDPLGAADGGKPVALSAVSAEVKLP